MLSFMSVTFLTNDINKHLLHWDTRSLYNGGKCHKKIDRITHATFNECSQKKTKKEYKENMLSLITTHNTLGNQGQWTKNSEKSLLLTQNETKEWWHLLSYTAVCNRDTKPVSWVIKININRAPNKENITGIITAEGLWNCRLALKELWLPAVGSISWSRWARSQWSNYPESYSWGGSALWLCASWSMSS